MQHVLTRLIKLVAVNGSTYGSFNEEENENKGSFEKVENLQPIE
jgi:hypothetical protein